LFAGIYGLVAMEAHRKGPRETLRRTTYSASAGGYKALFLWLRDLGVPIRRWEKPLTRLPHDSSVLLMAEPETPLTTMEQRSVKRWVRAGGTLILVASPFRGPMETFGLKAKTLSPRELYADEKQGLLFQPGPYTRGVRRIAHKMPWRISAFPPEGVIHASDPQGGILMALAEGKGRVLALADPGLFSNRSLREGDHSRLAMNLLLSHLAGGALLVDEYHHGYGRATSVLTHFGRSPAVLPVAQGLLVLALLGWARSRRFGPPRPLLKREYRSSMEYVTALANLFWRYKASVHALEALSRWVEDEADRYLVKRDPALREAIANSRKRLKQGEIDDRTLLKETRVLYEALNTVRGKGAG
jgi:hypothetical protein